MSEAPNTASESSQGNIGPLLELSQPLASPNSRINRVKAGVKDDTTKGKRRTSARSTGKLAKFLTMPLDAIFEIAHQLLPLDLLQLSRVSKDFRRTFGSRSARLLWKEVRKAMNEIPDPPEHINELQYASVLFERNCYACGVGRSPKVCYALMIRLCGACWKLNVKRGSSLLWIDRTLHEEMFHLCTVAEGSVWIWENKAQSPVHNKAESYYVPELKAVVGRYNSLSSQDRSAFTEARKKFVHERYLTSQAVHAWEQRVVADKRDAAKTRQEAIEDRLLEMGYTRDDFPGRLDPAWNSLVNQPRPLTSSIWKKIQPQLVQAMKDHKAQLLKQAKKKLRQHRADDLYARYKVYVETLPEDEGPLPPCDKLALIEPVNTLMDREDDGLPIPAADMDAVIPEATKRYCEEARRNLIAVLRGSSPAATGSSAADGGPSSPNGSDDNDDALRWASSFFGCCFCEIDRDPLPYTQLLQHLRTAHLRSSIPIGRLYFQPSGYDETLFYPYVHVAGRKKAMRGLKLIDLPMHASLEEANERLGRLYPDEEVRPAPASFAQAILEETRHSTVLAW